ncbi:MAG: hypothetical protein KF688_06150 [Pirellulales bacterium]|nr:hypothetical protein [Pirellulales bacterium]
MATENITESTAATAQIKFEAASKIFDERIASDSVMCRIHSVFVGDDPVKHNCLGCNLEDLSEQISRFLKSMQNEDVGYKPHHPVSLYLFLLNTLWERITDIFDIVSVPDEYRARHFEPLRRVRRWANFFKHPKEFAWIVHHPEYVFEGSSGLTALKVVRPGVLLIDDQFVKSFYSCERKKGLRKALEHGKDNTAVVLPDIENLTTEVCDCIDKCVSTIVDNPIYLEMLDDKCTIANYYDRECAQYE